MRRTVRSALVIMAVSFAGFLALLAQEAPPQPPKLPAKDWKDAKSYQVVGVESAENVVLSVNGKEVKIHLLGVDAPAAMDAKQEAERSLRSLLLGESVFVEFGADKAEGYVFRAPEGLFVNLELIRQGHASANNKMAAEYAKSGQFYEKEAKRAQRGSWGPPNFVFIGKDSKSYHREGCARLGKTKMPIPVTREIAVGNDYQPCKVCKP